MVHRLLLLLSVLALPGCVPPTASAEPAGSTKTIEWALEVLEIAGDVAVRTEGTMAILRHAPGIMPIIDVGGLPVFAPDGRPVMDPVYDGDGNPVLDGEGLPVLKQREEPDGVVSLAEVRRIASLRDRDQLAYLIIMAIAVARDQ